MERVGRLLMSLKTGSQILCREIFLVHDSIMIFNLYTYLFLSDSTNVREDQSILSLTKN